MYSALRVRNRAEAYKIVRQMFIKYFKNEQQRSLRDVIQFMAVPPRTPETPIPTTTAMTPKDHTNRPKTIPTHLAPKPNFTPSRDGHPQKGEGQGQPGTPSPTATPPAGQKGRQFKNRLSASPVTHKGKFKF